MANPAFSTKRIAISKANARMVGIVAIATFVTVFSMVASKYLIAQESYQARVIKQQNVASEQLKANLASVEKLEASYKAFISSPANIIGGSSTGTAENDGNNAQIILDALPSKYDFPALTTSISTLLNNQNLNISAIGGTDDQVNQQENMSSSDPQPVEIPFTFSISNAKYASVQKITSILDHSIRPIRINQMTLSGGESDMSMEVTATTYYQPAKNLNIQMRVVK